MEITKNQLITALSFTAILITAYITFLPGITGPFIMDDYSHLPHLTILGSDPTFSSTLEFIFKEAEGTDFGRPLSYLSLLINDFSWPSNAESFKKTNILIHLLNGVLAFSFFRFLLGAVSSSKSGDFSIGKEKIALVAMLFWILHPLQLSTMMLVIQRMTLLMGTAVLIGLIIYLYGRELINRERKTSGYVAIVFAYIIACIVGLLCKENAVLFVFFAALVEWLLKRFSDNYKFLPFNRLLVVSGVVVLILLLFYYFLTIGRIYEMRPFTMGERLLTEARILWKYLYLICIPQLGGMGPYNDDFQLSTGLLQPLTTLISVVAISVLLAFVIAKRKTYPFLFFCIVWYFLGHTLESTFLPLELYFEHRNYVPMLGMALGFSLMIFNLMAIEKLKRIVLMACIIYVSFLVSITALASKMWGDNLRVSFVWATEHPSSLRASLHAARKAAEMGDLELARKYYLKAIKHHPNQTGLYLYLFYIEDCAFQSPNLSYSTEKLKSIALNGDFSFGAVFALGNLVEQIETQSCRTLESKDVKSMLSALLNNPKFSVYPRSLATLYTYKSRLGYNERNLDVTLQALEDAYSARSSYEYKLNQAYLLATAGLFTEAEDKIEQARETKPMSIFLTWTKKRKIREMEQLVMTIKDRARVFE